MIRPRSGGPLIFLAIGEAAIEPKQQKAAKLAFLCLRVLSSFGGSPRRCALRRTMTISVDAAPSLASCSLDVAVSVLMCIDRPLDLCRVASVCHGLHSAVNDAILWRKLLKHRYGRLEVPEVTTAGAGVCHARETFRERWTRAQGFVWQAAHLDERAPPEPCLSPHHAVHADKVTCMSKSCEANSSGVSEERYARGVDMVGDAVADGSVAADDLVDWFLSARADRQPIRGLALLAVLHRSSQALTDADADECVSPVSIRHSWCMSARAIAERRRKAATSALQHLAGACGSSPSLLQEVVIKYTTWSQARDCRGFVDDVHRIQADLRTLCLEPEHPAWTILERGVINEVRNIRILCAV